MLRSKKNKSILSSLYDRQLNNARVPYFLCIDIISQLLRSNAHLYRKYWQKSSKRPITYDSGYLYFNDYTKCYTIYGKDKPSLLFNLQKSKASKKISDIISYSIPVYRNFVECSCKLQPCTCLSQYLLSVSEDNWLCKHSMETGKLFLEIYAGRFNKSIRFKYCDWDVYGERFILTSTLNPDSNGTVSKKSDVVVNLAVFNAVPFEFFALLEIKRSVFGAQCNAANVSDQHLIIGVGSTQVHIYNFVDFINKGHLIPYKLGEPYENGFVGSYPTGLPLNFTYTDSSPLLHNVQSYGQIVRYGGYPYHYITASPKNAQLFTVQSLESNKQAVGGSLESRALNDDRDLLIFHPDNSNRLIFRDSNAVHCFTLVSSNDTCMLNKSFSMNFTEERVVTRNDVSLFGRRLKKRYNNDSMDECSVFCMDYANDLDVIAIMGVCQSDSNSVGFIKLYDSFTGEEMRILKLKDSVCDSHFYQLFIDMGDIVLIERKDRLAFTVHVYIM